MPRGTGQVRQVLRCVARLRFVGCLRGWFWWHTLDYPARFRPTGLISWISCELYLLVTVPPNPPFMLSGRGGRLMGKRSILIEAAPSRSLRTSLASK